MKTPLYNFHVKNSAKMVDFSGYDLPVSYGEGIIAEHIYTREICSLFDVSHMGQLLVDHQLGTRHILESLERLCPTNLHDLALGQSRYSVLMNEKGGIEDDFIISHTEMGIVIVLNASRKDHDLNYLNKYLGKGFSYSFSDNALLAIQGPQAASILHKFFQDIDDLYFMQNGVFEYLNYKFLITRSGYTGEDGFEVSVPIGCLEQFLSDLEKTKIKPAGLGARDTLRLEAGLCLYGQDLNEEISPVEAALSWLISKERRGSFNFLGGQEIKKQLEENPKNIRLGMILEGRQIARYKTSITTSEGKVVGMVTSGAYSPSLQASICMGYIDKENMSDNLYVQIRNKLLPLKIGKLPFYQPKYKRGFKHGKVIHKTA